MSDTRKALETNIPVKDSNVMHTPEYIEDHIVICYHQAEAVADSIMHELAVEFTDNPTGLLGRRADVIGTIQASLQRCTHNKGSLLRTVRKMLTE